MTGRRMGPRLRGNDGFAYNYWMTLEPHVHPDRISRLRS